MDTTNQNPDFYFEESEKFFEALKKEFEYYKGEKATESGELPFWVSKR